MDIINEIYKEWAWRSETGTPSFDNERDIKILNELYKNWGIVIDNIELLQEAQKIEKSEEEEPITEEDIQSLINLINTRKSDLTSLFLKKVYHQIESTANKTGHALSSIIDSKNLTDAKIEIFHYIAAFPGLEPSLLSYLKEKSKQVTISDLKEGGDIVQIIATKAKESGIPEDFVKTLANAGAGSSGGKGVGRGEALLALMTRGGKKASQGDVQMDGATIEVKAKGARLGDSDVRSGNLANLYKHIASLVGRTESHREVNLKKYIKEVVDSLHSGESETDPQPIITKIKEQLLIEFPSSQYQTLKDINLQNTTEVENVCLSWYVDQFFNSKEASIATHIAVFLEKTGKIYTKDEFRVAVMDRQILFDGFSKSKKYPQIQDPSLKKLNESEF